jgi:hypothetical protein
MFYRMDPHVKSYLSRIGRRGGRVSRRTLEPGTARRMVKVREARRAFRAFHAECFWSFDSDYLPCLDDVPWVAKRLMEYGGRQGWELGAKLRPEFQGAVARLLAPQRTPDSYLAGDAAMHIEPTSNRYSNDLDYFQDSEERVATVFADDRAVLEAEGFAVQVALNQPGFIRAIVKSGSEATKVEWAHDSAWRFMLPVKSDVAGYMLHPVDLAINKVLALVGRDEPRDFLDTLDAHRQQLTLGALCWAGAGKDPGFTPTSLLGLLRRRGRYHAEDFTRLKLREQPVLTTLKEEWLAALEGAEEFVSTRPPAESGCLYYSRSKEVFVSDFEVGDPDVVPHFGRPGGVLPCVGRQ